MTAATLGIISAYAGTIGSVVGTGVSLYGAHKSSQAQDAMAKYNERLAQRKAEEEARATATNVSRKREESRRQLAAMRAKMAGAGLQTGVGSPLLHLGAAASDLESQALDLFRSGDMRFKSAISEGQMARYEGRQASTATLLNGYSDALSGLGKVGGQVGEGIQNGLFGDRRYLHKAR